MGVLFLFIGLVISIQTKSQAEKESFGKAPARQLEDMVALLKESEEKRDDLQKQLSNIKKQIEELRSSKEIGIPKAQQDKIYQLAGLTEVKGKGLRVILDDRSSSNFATPDNDGLVHSEDILKLVNELKSAGASAISVNNQRLVTTSEIVDAGSSIMVNQTRLVSPYSIQATGDPEALEASLTFRGSILEYLKFYGIDVKVQPQQKVTIPPYTGKL